MTSETDNKVEAAVELIAAPCTLQECPPGPFRFNGSLGFKTEYHLSYPSDLGGGKFEYISTPWPDAYCMDSGEVFWGGAKTHEERGALIVQPIELAIASLDRTAPETAEPAQEVAGLVEKVARIIDPLAYADFPVGGAEPDHDWWDRQRAMDKAKAILAALSSSPSQGGETVDRSGVAAADNNHKALVEAAQALADAIGETLSGQWIIIGDGELLSSDLNEALAAFTTKGMDHG